MFIAISASSGVNKNFRILISTPDSVAGYPIGNVSRCRCNFL